MASGWLLERLAGFGDRTALILDGTATTYDQLMATVGAARDFLKDNAVESGRVVAIRSDYSPAAAGMLLALMENGNIAVPVTNTLKQEIAEILMLETGTQ